MSFCRSFPKQDLPICECIDDEAKEIYFSTKAFDDEISAPRPGIFLWKFLNEEETSYLLREGSDSQNVMSLLEKKIGADETLLLILLNETFKFCRKQYKKNLERISALMGTVYYTHRYFVASKWRKQADTYYFFRESILCQSVESPPESIEVFEPNDAKEAIIFFFETYIRNLPLVRLLHLPHYKLLLKAK